jgi:hypothetical protein
MRHTVYIPHFTQAQLDVPETCPSCGADFTQPGSLIESDWVDCTVKMHVAGEELVPEGETDYGATFMPNGVACAHCDWHLAPVPGSELPR